MTIQYVTGDATQPQGPGLKIIAHICNNAGGWGAGFVLALSKRWAQPEASYRRWYTTKHGFSLGKTQLVQVDQDIIVANMIAQEGFGGDGKPPIRYGALHDCLLELVSRIKNNNLSGMSLKDASVHMPRIGCGLAGGNWNDIRTIINVTLIESGIPVTVYDLPNSR